MTKTPKTTADLERLLTVHEVAELEATSEKTVRRRIAAGHQARVIDNLQAALVAEPVERIGKGSRRYLELRGIPRVSFSK